MSFKRKLSKIHWILRSQFGLDFITFFKAPGLLSRYIKDWRKFRKEYNGKMVFVPCLHDRTSEGGVTGSEYFWQDLIVARMIFENKPEKHMDIGSRIDGFVAHIATFREIEVFDIRPVNTKIPGVIFKQSDFMSKDSLKVEYSDSISCLHALEHFGLGRYGDELDVNGYKKGLANISGMLKFGGILYLSVPIGIERIEFNANRIFDPHEIVELGKLNGLTLSSLLVVHPNGGFEKVELTHVNMKNLSNENYSLGIFTFEKLI